MPIGEEIYAEVDGEQVRVNQSDALVLCGTPLTTAISAYAGISYKEY